MDTALTDSTLKPILFRSFAGRIQRQFASDELDIKWCFRRNRCLVVPVEGR